MFRQMVFVQWKVSRWGVFLLAIICFGFPLAILRIPGLGTEDPMMLRDVILLAQRAVLPSFPALAVMTGMTLAMTAWSWDQAGKHVYALSLPLPRWEYVLLKFGAGILMLSIPVLALLIGGRLAIAQLDLPEGLRGYSVAFAGRFFLASLIAYSAFFAFGAATVQTTVRLFVGFCAIVFGGHILVDFLTTSFGVKGLVSPVDLLGIVLTKWPGPFHVFAGNWMLIDV